jgi:hypothetical protein
MRPEERKNTVNVPGDIMSRAFGAFRRLFTSDRRDAVR